MCTCNYKLGYLCPVHSLADLMCDVIVTMEDLGPRFPILGDVDEPVFLKPWEVKLVGAEPSPIFDALIDSRVLVPSISLY